LQVPPCGFKQGMERGAYPWHSRGNGVVIQRSRKAAEPGVVERIASFLADNDYTRAWDGAVQAGVRPLDRLIASDEDLMKGAAPAFGRAAAMDGGIGPVLRETWQCWTRQGVWRQKSKRI